MFPSAQKKIHVCRSSLFSLLRFALFLALLILWGCGGKADSFVVPTDMVCYAATYMKGIYRSENGGESWYSVDVDQKVIHTYYKRLFRAPWDTERLYITTSGGGLFEMNLQTRELQSVAGFKEQYVNSLAFIAPRAKHDPAKMLVGTGDNGVFEANNPEKHFGHFNAGLTYREVNTIYVDPNETYVGTLSGIFRLDKKTGRWMDFSSGIRNNNILSLCSPYKTDTIYAGSGVFEGKKGRFEEVASLYRSKAGKPWEPLDAGLPEGTIVYSIVANAKRPERIYLGTSSGVYRSVNGGESWSDINKGLAKGMKVFKVETMNTEDGRDLICIATTRGVFMTNDTDKPLWKGKSYGLPQTVITDVMLVK